MSTQTLTPPTPSGTQTFHNHTLAALHVGDSAQLERTLTLDEIRLFAMSAGSTDPRQLDDDEIRNATSDGVGANGLWAGALVSALIGGRLPGAGSVCHSQNLRFLAPLHLGDTLTLTVEVAAIDRHTNLVTLLCNGHNQQGQPVLKGKAVVSAPTESRSVTRYSLPDLRVLSAQPSETQRLLDRVRTLGAIKAAVVHPCDELSLTAALDARKAGLIEPILVGPRAKIVALADQLQLDLSGIEIEDAPHSHAAATQAAQLAKAGAVETLVKGSLHTDELMSAVVSSAAGLRTKRRISHCFLMHTTAYPRPFIITDAAINIAPDLLVKADIVRNAITLAQAIGVAVPRVAILAAVESVNPAMPSTLDAAALCKMADRGQIEGGVLDGPLAFDNAISLAAARTKGINSPVSGQADILVVPDLESGNMLAKQLMYLGHAASAGIVMGAKLPIVLTSRADSHESRIASAAIAVLLAHHYRSVQP